VYLFAHCPSGHPPKIPRADRLPEEVVYVGDAKNLNARPLSGEHHRIKRYKKLFGKNTESLFITFAKLYETGCDDYAVQRIYSFHAEALLAWNYTKRHGHPPAMQYKEKGKTPGWVREVVKKLKAKRP
jgi:hypothetical protein